MAAIKATHRVWEFGLFRLDESERLLLREGLPVGLTPKVFDTLVALIEQSGHLVEKEDLMERLWPDTFVEEGALTRNISDLRKALGDARFVETVPKRGYRFVFPVKQLDDDGGTLILQRTTEAHLVIEEEEEVEKGTQSDLADTYASHLSTVAVQHEAGKPATREAGPLTPAVQLGEQRKTPRTLKTRVLAILALSLLVAVVAVSFRQLFRTTTSPEEKRVPFQSMQVSRFTASGNILTAAISPDGKYIATVVEESGLQSLWVRQVASNTSGVRLIAPALVDYWGLTFSNDSNFIYYVSWVRNEADARLHALPVLGGATRSLPIPIDTPISFSPAGDRFAYVFSSSSKGESYVKHADISGEHIDTLAKRQKPQFFAAYPGGPAWSPDGRVIAYAAGLAEPGRQHASVFVADLHNEERRLTASDWYDIGRVAWLGDGSGLVISAREQMDAPRQLWLVSYPEGAARRITNDLHDYESVSLTADAKTLTAVQTQEAFSISIAPQGTDNHTSPDNSSTNEIFSEIGSGHEFISWAADNRIVYCSRASGNWDIWIMNKDGSEQRQLTVDSSNDLFPAASADGHFIFFSSDRAGAFNIWRIGIDGSNRTQLTQGGNETLPEPTSDGRWVVYQQGLGLDEPSVWRVPSEGGEPQRLSDSLTMRPVASPDARLLAYVYLDQKDWGLAVLPFDKSDTGKRLPFPSTVGSHFFRWAPDGQALAYIANEKGASNIWLQPLNGEPPKRLTNFSSGQLLSFAWAPDGKALAYMRRATISDVVLLRDFR